MGDALAPRTDADTRGRPPEPRRVLVLHIEVPDVWADDLDENVAEFYNGDYLDAVLDPDCMGLSEDVALALVVLGDESGPLAFAKTGRVVGAEARARG